MISVMAAERPRSFIDSTPVFDELLELVRVKVRERGHNEESSNLYLFLRQRPLLLLSFSALLVGENDSVVVRIDLRDCTWDILTPHLDDSEQIKSRCRSRELLQDFRRIIGDEVEVENFTIESTYVTVEHSFDAIRSEVIEKMKIFPTVDMEVAGMNEVSKATSNDMNIGSLGAS